MNRYFAWFGLPGSFVLTVCLSLFALGMALWKRRADRWICFAGMLMCSAGDIFLMRFMGLHRIFPDYFTIGAVCFMVGHLLYALAYRKLARRKGLRFFNGGVICALLMAAVCLAYFTWMCIRRGDFGMYPLAMIYLLIITANCASVFSYAWAEGRRRPAALLAAVGAISFFVSDLFIGLDGMAGVDSVGHLIWWFYPIGQILLIAAEE